MPAMWPLGGNATVVLVAASYTLSPGVYTAAKSVAGYSAVALPGSSGFRSLTGLTTVDGASRIAMRSAILVQWLTIAVTAAGLATFAGTPGAAIMEMSSYASSLASTV